MVTQLSSSRNSQRDSQSYIEQIKKRREIEVLRERKGRIKRGESNQLRKQIPK